MTFRYGLHFTALILAVVAFWFVMAFDLVPRWVDGLAFYFGLMGVLHATSLVVSLRDRKGVVAIVGFVALAAVLSVATPLIMFVLAWLTSHSVVLSEDARLFLCLGMASALGGSAYWLVIRCFWFRSLTWTDLMMTAAMCASVAVLSWLGAGKLTPRPGRWNPRDVIPTAAWWATFSLSLLLSEERIGNPEDR